MESQVIVPEYRLLCNGRITGYLISLNTDSSSGGLPSVQVWHPTSSTTYTRVPTVCALTVSDISMMTDSMGDEYYLGNVSCTGNNTIEFQSGDVIGYHQGDEVHYALWNIDTMGYTSYRRNAPNPLQTFDINNVQDTFNDRQPLIQVIFGKIQYFIVKYMLAD